MNPNEIENDYLALIEAYMDLGYSEEFACRMAARDLHPETYDAADYDCE